MSNKSNNLDLMQFASPLGFTTPDLMQFASNEHSNKDKTMTYLMNPATGSVDTAENWRDDYAQAVETGLEELWTSARLIEVVRDSDGRWIDYEAAVELMDVTICQELHRKQAPCSNQEFFDAYCAEHLGVFGEYFTVE